MHRFDTDLSDLVINVTTRYSDDFIEQEVSNGREVIARNVCQLQNECVKKALSELVYLSPEEAKETKDLKTRLRLARNSNLRLAESYTKAVKEKSLLVSKLNDLKKEWEKKDHHEVSVGQKLEALINILYSDRE